MARSGKPKGYGRVVVRAGQTCCRWRLGGGDVLRDVANAAAGEYVLALVHKLRAEEGLDLLPAIDRATGKRHDEKPAPGRVTFAAALDLYLDASDRGATLKRLRARTLKTNRERAGILREAPWASMPLDSIGRKAVRAWAATRQAAGASGKTVLNDLVLASSVWKWADDEELLGDDCDNPFLRARPRGFHRKARRALDEAEVLALADGFRDAAPAAYPLFLAAIFTGWRAGELCGLREADLHLEDPRGPCFTLPAHREKARHDKCAFLGEPLASMLRAERAGRPRLPSAYVFTDEDGRAWTQKTRAKRMRDALGAVDAKEIPAWKRISDPDHVGLDWHTLRHTVRSILSSRGHRPAVLGELLGQANLATQRRYDHAYAREALAVAADVAQLLAPRKTGAQAQA